MTIIVLQQLACVMGACLCPLLWHCCLRACLFALQAVHQRTVPALLKQRFCCFVWGGVSSWAGELGCDSWAHVDEAPPRGRRATARRLGLQRLVLRDVGGEGCEQ